MSRISAINKQKIKEEVYAIIQKHTDFGEGITTTKIANAMARDNEFISFLVKELEKEGLIKKDVRYTEWEKWITIGNGNLNAQKRLGELT